MPKKKLLQSWMAGTVVVLVNAVIIPAVIPSDPVAKVSAGMTVEQVRAALEGPGMFCSEHTEREVDGTITKHRLRYGWRFGTRILLVEFTVKRDTEGNAVPDRATGEIAWASDRGDDPKRGPAEATSRAASKTPAKDLRKVADDPQADRAKRVKAVFALFANHLKPPCGPAAAGGVLEDAKWLTTARLYPFHVLGGWVPVEFGGDATVYSLHVFPIKDGWSDSVIYVRLTGGSGQSADDLRAFLRGGKGLIGNRELVEFALCYPPEPKPNPFGRIECFGPKGFRVVFGEN